MKRIEISKKLGSVPAHVDKSGNLYGFLPISIFDDDIPMAAMPPMMFNTEPIQYEYYRVHTMEGNMLISLDMLAKNNASGSLKERFETVFGDSVIVDYQAARKIVLLDLEFNWLAQKLFMNYNKFVNGIGESRQRYYNTVSGYFAEYESFMADRDNRTPEGVSGARMKLDNQLQPWYEEHMENVVGLFLECASE